MAVTGAGATLAAGPVSVAATGAQLGLVLSGAGRVLYARGTFTVTAADLTGSGTVEVRQNTTSTDFTGGSITASGVTVSSIPTMAAGVTAFSGTGLSIDVAGFVTLSGDFGFEKSASEIRMAVTGASASLAGGPGAGAGADRTGSGTVEVRQNTTSTDFTAGSITASGVTVSSIPTMAAGVTAF